MYAGCHRLNTIYFNVQEDTKVGFPLLGRDGV
jgi:hypothetical protein